MVGCVVVGAEGIVGEGWHQRFGGPHAEVEALASAGVLAREATLYVTLEPCSHFGKTPPCVEAIVAAQVRRVVIAHSDPNPTVAGRGIEQLRRSGIEVEVGLLDREASELNAPYLKLTRTRHPWVIAKWAMTLDGKIATRTGHSKWISGARSRAVVHQLRRRVDAVLVGRGTADLDDPLLTARPPGPRTATRIVLDTDAQLSLNCQLVRTTSEAPVLVVTGPEASEARRRRLTAAGCEVFVCNSEHADQRMGQLLDELGKRQMTNLLIEGGSHVLGTAFDLGFVDEVHVFVANKVVGGSNALSPITGNGVAKLGDALALGDVQVQQLDQDLYIQGRLGN